MSTPRAKTAEEARKDFLDHIRHLVQYWASRQKVALTGQIVTCPHCEHRFALESAEQPA